MKPRLTVNGHVEHLLEKHEEMMRVAQTFDTFQHDLPTEAEKDAFMKRFSTFAHRKFITQYCQERLYMFHRYDTRGILFRELLQKNLIR